MARDKGVILLIRGFLDMRVKGEAVLQSQKITGAKYLTAALASDELALITGLVSWAWRGLGIVHGYDHILPIPCKN